MFLHILHTGIRIMQALKKKIPILCLTWDNLRGELVVFTKTTHSGWCKGQEASGYVSSEDNLNLSVWRK